VRGRCREPSFGPRRQGARGGHSSAARLRTD
jgi:hypothetical protein